MKKIFAELFEQFVKSNKREPKGMELIQLKFKASQQAVDERKIVSMFDRSPVDANKPILGGRNIEETESQIKQRLIDQNKKGIESLLKNKENTNSLKKELMKTDNPFSDLVKTTKKGPKSLEQRRKEAEEALRNKNVVPIKDPGADDVPFAGGGPVDFENWKKGKDQFEKEQGEEQLYREYLEQMRRKKIYDTRENVAEGGRPTSTGLNYLVGEDDTNSRVPYAAGGRRGFLKLLGGLGAAGVAFKTGLLGLGKGVAKPAAKVAAEAATSGAPPHFLKLVAKIKALGDESTAKYATKDREVVTSYKDYTLTEDISTGEKTIQRFKDSEVDYYDEILMEETYMSHTPGKGQMDETTKGRMPPDEYIEDTSYLRTSGPQKGDILETVSGVSDDIFKEVGEKIPEIIRKEKADGGRMGYAGGKKVVEGLISLLNKKAGKDVLTTADKIAIPKKTLDRDMFKKFNDKNPDPKKEMTEDEYQDFADEIGENIEAYDFDGTVGDANRIRKDIKDYEAEMYQQYKMGKLDPEAGDKSPARKRFLEKKFEEMEDSGDPQLMTRDEIEELTFFDLGTEMDDFVLSSAEKKGKKLADSMSDAEIDLRDEFPGIEDRLIKQILTDNNPQRVAEVKQTMREALEMQNKGISVDEIIQTFKGTTRTKQASGGRIGLLAGGGVLKKLIMNLAKEKGMSGSEVLKVMNYKSLPSKIKNLMTKEEFTSMKDQRLEGVEIWRDLMASQQEMTKNIDAGKNTPAAELFEMLEKTSPGYKTVPRNISDADMLQMEQMIKNMKTKDNRQLNAKGGLANLLGE